MIVSLPSTRNSKLTVIYIIMLRLKLNFPSCTAMNSHSMLYCNVGHMEKQETEMKWKLEMETGNGNWKRKWE